MAQWSDGPAEVTAGEREKDGLIATDLATALPAAALPATALPATALPATALAIAQRLREVRRCARCQRACRDEHEACCAEQTLHNQARRTKPAPTPCVRETDIDQATATVLMPGSGGGRESFGWRVRGMWTGMADPEKEGVRD